MSFIEELCLLALLGKGESPMCLSNLKENTEIQLVLTPINKNSQWCGRIFPFSGGRFFYDLLIILLNKTVTQHVITVSDNIKHLFKSKIFWTTLKKAIAESRTKYCRKQHFKSISFLIPAALYVCFLNQQLSAEQSISGKRKPPCEVHRHRQLFVSLTRLEDVLCGGVLLCLSSCSREHMNVTLAPVQSASLLELMAVICSQFPTTGIHKTMHRLFILQRYRHLE